ncbi:MAG: hypothetical protein ACYC9Z_13740 [Casimicrobiaceae bacterium]
MDVPLRLTIFESSKDRLSKSYQWSSSALLKAHAPPLYEGSTWSTDISSPREFAALLDSLPARQAIGLCNAQRDKTKVVVDRVADPAKGTIARTRDNFEWDSTAPALMLFDVDAFGYTPQWAVAIIRGLDPAFENAVAVGRFSTSSFIACPDGSNTGQTGVHLFIPVRHPERMQAVGTILAQRLWLAGYGHIALSTNGRMLPRQLIDAAVWSPERLVYEVSPLLGHGLTQHRPAAEMLAGKIVDLSRVTPLTSEESAAYRSLVGAAKAAKLPEARRVYEAYLEANAERLGTAVQTLREKWRGLAPDAVDASDTRLPPDFILDLGQHGRMTVRRLTEHLGGGGRLDGNFPDPIEGPEYGRTCAYLQPEKTHDGQWRIYSQAHGGAGYVLQCAAPPAVSEETTVDATRESAAALDVPALAATVRALIPALKSDPGALFDDFEAHAALTQIRAADRGAWARLRKEILATRAFRAEELDEWLEPTDNPGKERSGDDDKSQLQRDLVTGLIELVKKDATLGYEDECTGVVIVNGGTRRRVYRVPSTAFDIWLRGAYFTQSKRAIPDATLKTAGQTVLAECVASTTRVQTEIRVAKGPDDAYYIDLGDEAGQAVRVTAGGWEVVSNPPVLFLRLPGALPLPEPQRLTEPWKAVLSEHLLAHLNLPAREATVAVNGKGRTRKSRAALLLLTSILEAFRPDTPYPVLEIDGEQGSAKSVAQKRIRDVIDPHVVPLRGRPRDVEDIFVAAANNHVVSFENVSSLTADHQDAICVLSTGGGHAGRSLYTNGEEYSIKAKRPVFINGIGPTATRPDLIDRVVHIELPAINETARRTERELDAAWGASRSLAFSALLDCLSATLAQLPNVKLTARPRMADFAELGAALMLAMGESPSVFLDALHESRAAGLDRAMDTYPVAAAVLDLIRRQPAGFSGTAAELYKELRCEFAGQENSPRSARGMSGQLKRVAPALRARGINVAWGAHTRGGNRITIRSIPPPVASTAAATSASRTATAVAAHMATAMHRP